MKFKDCRLEDLKIINKPSTSDDVFTIMVGDDGSHYHAVYVNTLEVNGVALVFMTVLIVFLLSHLFK